MSKIRIYIEPIKIKDILSIHDKDIVRKIYNVLRLKKGQAIAVFDGEGKEYSYSISSIDKQSLIIKKEEIVRDILASDKRITLGFPLMKEEKIDFILQKATELGVFGFVPFISQRSLQSKPSLSKFARWQKITIEASRQSERVYLPVISDILPLAELVKRKYDAKFLASMEGLPLEDLSDCKKNNVLILVGPEGDFSLKEHSIFQENNFQFIKLSQNILRSETAGVFFTGLMSYLLNKNE